MRARLLNILLSFTVLTALRCGLLQAQSFSDRWTYVSETSAAVYWRDGAIGSASLSWVEYGPSRALGAASDSLRRPRWAHLHHLTGLAPGDTCFYRLVALDTLTGLRRESPLLSLVTVRQDSALRIPRDVAGPPYILDHPGASYILTEDLTVPEDGIRISAENVTLDLDGHTLTFGDSTDEQVFGVRFSGQGAARLFNGRIVQGRRSGDYSCAVRSSGRPYRTEIAGISTDVHLRCAYPVNFLNQAVQLDLHHCHLYSRVAELQSRHYPGNALLRVALGAAGGVHIHDNLLTEGCHRAIMLEGDGPGIEIDHNDIQHHMQFVNGYAINSVRGVDIHHNRITSTGRGIHLTAPEVKVHSNYLDLKGHVDLDDMPQDSRPFQFRYVELHGIKFEETTATDCQVYDNFVRIVQHLPTDSQGRGDPLDKIDNGVFVRSTAAAVSGTGLSDPTQKWEPGRWTGYLLKYSPDQPAARISGNDGNSLNASINGAAGGEYSIYMPWTYVPATPLNIACYDPNAGNEVWGNTFVALTEYSQPRHGDYGDSGEWASPLMFVDMNQGQAGSGSYSILIRDNTFISNDLFLNSSYAEVSMTVRLENNRFELVDSPPHMARSSRFRGVGAALEAVARGNGNEFSLAGDSPELDLNRDSRLSLADVLKFLLLAWTQPVNPALDFDRDGRATVADALWLSREIVSRSGQ